MPYCGVVIEKYKYKTPKVAEVCGLTLGVYIYYRLVGSLERPTK